MQAALAAFIFCRGKGARLRLWPLSPKRPERVMHLSSLWRQTVIESP